LLYFLLPPFSPRGPCVWPFFFFFFWACGYAPRSPVLDLPRLLPPVSRLSLVDLLLGVFPFFWTSRGGPLLPMGRGWPMRNQQTLSHSPPFNVEFLLWCPYLSPGTGIPQQPLFPLAGHSGCCLPSFPPCDIYGCKRFQYPRGASPLS